MRFYRYNSPGRKLSRFLTYSENIKKILLEKLEKNNPKLINIICFCFMPNHFHFLLKQMEGEGIANFMSNFQNSFTRYFNTKCERIGPIFQGSFKAVRIETEQQMLHVSRYIHLNPYSSFIVKSPSDTLDYPWSSFPEYINGRGESSCQKDIILSHFKEGKGYQNFVLDRADYQRSLESIKHLILEKEK